MRSLTGYGTAAVVLVGTATALSWPFLGTAGRQGLLAAGGIALAVQLPAFGLLLRFRFDPRKFLLVWGGGTVVRLGLVLVAGFVVGRTTRLAPAPTLLGLAGFLFALLLLEAFFLRPAARTTPGDGVP